MARWRRGHRDHCRGGGPARGGGWRHHRQAHGARLVTIAPPPEVDPAGAGALWANLAGTLAPSWRRRLVYGTPHVVWQYAWAGRQLTIIVWVPGTVPAGGGRGRDPRRLARRHRHHQPQPPAVPARRRPRHRRAPAPALRRLAAASRPTTTPTRCGRSPPPAAACATASTRACRSWPARPGRAGSGGPAVPPPGSATAAPRPGLRSGRTVRWVPRPVRHQRPPAPARRRCGADPAVERDVRAILDKTAHPLWETALRYAAAAPHPARGDPAPGLAGHRGRAGVGVRRLHRPQPAHPPHPACATPVSVDRRPAARARVPHLDPGTRRSWPGCRRIWPCAGLDRARAKRRRPTGRGPRRRPRHEGPRRRRDRRPRGRAAGRRRPLSPAHARRDRVRQDDPARRT